MREYLQRTDLAVEIHENMENRASVSGVHVSVETDEENRIRETEILIESQEGVSLYGKPIGTYITIESENLCQGDEEYHVPLSKALFRHLHTMIGERRRILIAGLGNRAVTPDALGPYVIDNLYITRHLFEEGLLPAGYEISAIAPGVMAQTGMETQEVLQAVISMVKPDLLVVIDALAAMDSGRLNKTIQISDAGITPGAGVGNDRKSIIKESMGVPVIAIGVPTVISVPAFVADAMDRMVDTFCRSDMKRLLDTYTEEERYRLATKMLRPELADMYVTPKNIDAELKRISYTISEAINHLHASYI